MDSANPHKVASLENALAALEELVTLSNASIKQKTNAQKMNYQRQFALAYEAITNIKIDPTNEESVKQMKYTDRAIQNKTKERTRVASVFMNIKNVFAGAESLPDLLSRVDKLPGQLFGGRLEQEFSDSIDESTIEFKRRWMQQQVLITSKLREFYGPNWRKKSRKFSRPTKTGITLNQSEGLTIPLNSIKLKEKDTELVLSQNQMYYWYNQFKDPSLHPTFERMLGENYLDIMSQIEKLLEPEVKAFADWQVDVYFPSVYEHYNRTYQRMYRTDMPWNKHYAGRLYREGIEDEGLNLLANQQSNYNQSIAAASTKYRINNTHDIWLWTVLMLFLHTQETWSTLQLCLSR